MNKREKCIRAVQSASRFHLRNAEVGEMFDAILAELREPDDRMRKASRFLTLPDGTETTFEDQEGDAVWQARIDAIGSGKP